MIKAINIRMDLCFGVMGAVPSLWSLQGACRAGPNCAVRLGRGMWSGRKTGNNTAMLSASNGPGCEGYCVSDVSQGMVGLS